MSRVVFERRLAAESLLSDEMEQRRRYRDALERIRTECGRVCNLYEICDHVACASSYKAWAIADHALRHLSEESAPR